LAIRSGRPSVNQDVLHNPAMLPWRQAALKRNFRSSIALPLPVDGVVLGCLSIYAAAAGAFDEEEVQLLEELAHDLAFGIQMLRTRAACLASEERAAYLQRFDRLTGLPNRLLLRDRFAQVAAATPAVFAMLSLDLDRFQHINDSLGHEAGDCVLRMAASRIAACLPAGSTLSRDGGDEFAVLLGTGSDAAQASAAATRLCAVFAEPFYLDGQALSVTASIGIALAPQDGDTFDTLFRCAHTAVRSAKEGGRSTYRYYLRSMNALALDQLRLAGAFADALRNREFELYYQPQIGLRSGRLTGAEALIRWQHPVDGLLAPGRFIGIAENSGHIVQIGEWTLFEACRQARTWLDAGRRCVTVAVNLSSVQFQHGDIVRTVAAALREHGLPPQLLELELTESILLQPEAVHTVECLKDLGVCLSIDDFGTGYSSLAYLQQLNVDKLKIDRSFVSNMNNSRKGKAIVKAIIELGHSLELNVIAEGVETAEQLAQLQAKGCDEVQGYWLGRPMTAAEFACYPSPMGEGSSPPA
jgi:diguanylate cyclase (GGDEF)-like protein